MRAARAYRSRPIKRSRRTRAEIENLREWIRLVVGRSRPMTVRQAFYALVSEGVIEKTEAEYKQTVVRLLVEMRREGEIPFSWIADNTRWMRKPDTFSSLEQALEHTAEFYRRALWNDQDAYVEIWCEKDALAGVIMEETDPYDVPLMVTRGYPSLSFLHSAAEAIAEQEKPAFIYYFGDRDPSGVDIPRHVERGLREMAPDADITFTCVAVTLEQVQELGLPTRPTKQTDTRARTFEGESVELDAIPPLTLRGMVSECIEAHIDPHVLRRTQAIEAEERNTLREMANLPPEGAA